jgi:hypothetical protein
MPSKRAHKLWLSKLITLARAINAAIDLSRFDKEDEITVSEVFGRIGNVLCYEDFGISANGLAWYLVLVLEMISMQEWTTFEEPTSPQH